MGVVRVVGGDVITIDIDVETTDLPEIAPLLKGDSESKT